MSRRLKVSAFRRVNEFRFFFNFPEQQSNFQFRNIGMLFRNTLLQVLVKVSGTFPLLGKRKKNPEVADRKHRLKQKENIFTNRIFKFGIKSMY